MRIGKQERRAALALILCAAGTTSGWAGQRGKASWYGRFHEGRLMANHRPFHREAATVAHRTLPLGTVIQVRNLSNDRVVQAEVTDRGPYVRGRMLDVSRGVAEQLGMVQCGVTQVEITVVPRQQLAEAAPAP